jgi:hypothetical protein
VFNEAQKYKRISKNYFFCLALPLPKALRAGRLNWSPFSLGEGYMVFLGMRLATK